ncbi:MAG: RNA polymerase sigma factor, partial [Bacteroidales bacterium]|nr:RNA polymerase sigma factor [Bacteroidales bacterium]
TDNGYYINQKSEQASANSEIHQNEKEIQKAINDLPGDYRIPFVMHTTGYKYKEIAEYLDQPLGSVKSKIFFARRRLMLKLKDYR